MTNLCACGCGEYAKPENKYINGHNLRLPEVQEKSAKGRIGHHHSDETKSKLSESKKGDNNPMKRPEVRKKNSEAKKGKTYEEMYGVEIAETKKQKMSVWMKENNPFRGEKHSNKTRAKISKNTKGKNKGKTLEELFGIEKAAEVKKKASERMKGNKINVGRHCSEEKRDKISKSNKGKPKSESHIKNWLKANKIKPNNAERSLNNILQSILPNEYKLNVSGDVTIIAGKIPDFINVNGQKKLIEVFGDYWHQNDNPQDRIDFFKQYGWDCLVIWEHELKNIEEVINKILNFHNLPSLSATKQLTL